MLQNLHPFEWRNFSVAIIAAVIMFALGIAAPMNSQIRVVSFVSATTVAGFGYGYVTGISLERKKKP